MALSNLFCGSLAVYPLPRVENSANPLEPGEGLKFFALRVEAAALLGSRTVKSEGFFSRTGLNQILKFPVATISISSRIACRSQANRTWAKSLIAQGATHPSDRSRVPPTICPPNMVPASQRNPSRCWQVPTTRCHPPPQQRATHRAQAQHGAIHPIAAEKWMARKF